MKPVFKCEYCNFIGTAEDVQEHEPNCTDNYNKKDCMTCKHCDMISLLTSIKCNCGKEIPSGHVYTGCDKYERKESRVSLNDAIRGFWRF